MRDLIVLGGEMRADGARLREWQHFQTAIVVMVKMPQREASAVHRYSSPSSVCPEFPSIIYKAGSLEGDRLFLCTQTECMIYRLPDFSVEHYVSLPLFNDLHHVTPTARDTLLIAVTGLDLVVEIDFAGTLINEWDVLGADTWTKFSKDIDYRKVPTTQPHCAHPNFVFMLGDEIWVTRCDLKDAVCLTNRSKRIDLSGTQSHPVDIVHDGILYGSRLYFTAVDGNVLIVDTASRETIEVVDLKDIVKSDYPLGWCRGIKVVDDERVIVGFSRLRRTKLHDKVRWAKAQVKRVSGMANYTDSLPSQPTRISCVNLRTREIEWEVPLADCGIDAVFSIL